MPSNRVRSRVLFSKMKILVRLSTLVSTTVTEVLSLGRIGSFAGKGFAGVDVALTIGDAAANGDGIIMSQTNIWPHCFYAFRKQFRMVRP